MKEDEANMPQFKFDPQNREEELEAEVASLRQRLLELEETLCESRKQHVSTLSDLCIHLSEAEAEILEYMEKVTGSINQDLLSFDIQFLNFIVEWLNEECDFLKSKCEEALSEIETAEKRFQGVHTEFFVNISPVYSKNFNQEHILSSDDENYSGHDEVDSGASYNLSNEMKNCNMIKEFGITADQTLEPSVKKQGKSAAERMRDYRRRKKELNMKLELKKNDLLEKAAERLQKFGKSKKELLGILKQLARRQKKYPAHIETGADRMREYRKRKKELKEKLEALIITQFSNEVGTGKFGALESSVKNSLGIIGDGILIETEKKEQKIIEMSESIAEDELELEEYKKNSVETENEYIEESLNDKVEQLERNMTKIENIRENRAKSTELKSSQKTEKKYVVECIREEKDLLEISENSLTLDTKGKNTGCEESEEPLEIQELLSANSSEKEESFTRETSKTRAERMREYRKRRKELNKKSWSEMSEKDLLEMVAVRLGLIGKSRIELFEILGLTVQKRKQRRNSAGNSNNYRNKKKQCGENEEPSSIYPSQIAYESVIESSETNEELISPAKEARKSKAEQMREYRKRKKALLKIIQSLEREPLGKEGEVRESEFQNGASIQLDKLSETDDEAVEEGDKNEVTVEVSMEKPLETESDRIMVFEKCEEEVLGITEPLIRNISTQYLEDERLRDSEENERELSENEDEPVNEQEESEMELVLQPMIGKSLDIEKECPRVFDVNETELEGAAEASLKDPLDTGDEHMKRRCKNDALRLPSVSFRDPLKPDHEEINDIEKSKNELLGILERSIRKTSETDENDRIIVFEECEEELLGLPLVIEDSHFGEKEKNERLQAEVKYVSDFSKKKELLYNLESIRRDLFVRKPPKKMAERTRDYRRRKKELHGKLVWSKKDLLEMAAERLGLTGKSKKELLEILGLLVKKPSENETESDHFAKKPPKTPAERARDYRKTRKELREKLESLIRQQLESDEHLCEFVEIKEERNEIFQSSMKNFIEIEDEPIEQPSVQYQAEISNKNRKKFRENRHELVCKLESSETENESVRKLESLALYPSETEDERLREPSVIKKKIPIVSERVVCKSRKTPAERMRKYREKKKELLEKLELAETEVERKEILALLSKKPRKTGAERMRAYRERKKAKLQLLRKETSETEDERLMKETANCINERKYSITEILETKDGHGIEYYEESNTKLLGINFVRQQLKSVNELNDQLLECKKEAIGMHEVPERKSRKTGAERTREWRKRKKEKLENLKKEISEPLECENKKICSYISLELENRKEAYDIR